MAAGIKGRVATGGAGMQAVGLQCFESSKLRLLFPTREPAHFLARRFPGEPAGGLRPRVAIAHPETKRAAPVCIPPLVTTCKGGGYRGGI